MILMNMTSIHRVDLLATDLDGTLLDSGGVLSEDNLQALEVLGRKGVCRVLATGRSMFSLRRALPDLLPVDYIVFSTGAGIFDVHAGEVIQQQSIEAALVETIATSLMRDGVSFMLHDPVPDNHRFAVYRGKGSLHPDFERRMSYYPGYWRWLEEDVTSRSEAAQFLLVVEDEAQYQEIADGMHGVHVIRTTSPIDHKSIWLEVFPSGVSKGMGIRAIMSRHGISPDHAVAMGNDYNDIDMLEVVGRPFVTANAPAALQARWPVIPSNDHHALSHLLDRLSI